MAEQGSNKLPVVDEATDTFSRVAADSDTHVRVEAEIAAARLIGALSVIDVPVGITENATAYSVLLQSKGIDVDPKEKVTIGILVDFGTFARDAWRSAREVGITNQHATSDPTLRHLISTAANLLHIHEPTKPSLDLHDMIAK